MYFEKINSKADVKPTPVYQVMPLTFFISTVTKQLCVLSGADAGSRLNVQSAMS